MRGTLLRCLVVLGLILPWALPAPDGQDDGLAPEKPAAKEDPRQTFANLEKGIYADFKAKDYAAAAKKCEAQIVLFPQQPGPYYNLACAQAQQDQKADALASLEKAVARGYNDPEHLKTDSDLASLQAEKQFADLAAKAAKNAEDNPVGYEKGADIQGVRSIEESPAGGLRYRLRLGETATKDKPHRLVLWLHPSGGSMNQQVEGQLAADLAKHGYALLVMTQKQWNGWNGEEAEKLLNKTLPAALKQAGVAQEKPILLGFSAGGQLALQLWEQNPTGFAGMILDAAYPLDVQAYMRGQQKVMNLPSDEGIKKVPILALVGTADPGSQLWKKVEPQWRGAGLPLTVEYVENGKHQWLVGRAQQQRLLSWLDAVAAGKFPGQMSAEEQKAAGTGREPTAAERLAIDEPAGGPEPTPAQARKPRPVGGQDDGLALGD